MRRKLWLIPLILVAAFVAWVARDLADTGRHDLRSFDAHQVATLETRMWRSYYDHQRLRLFAEMTELLRTQYGLPFWRSVVDGWHAAHAAAVFQPGHQRSDYQQALPDLESYYADIRRTSASSFDPHRAAELELEWWMVHRERARHPADALQHALADLQACIYQQPATDFQVHAQARAEAMLLRDQRAASGSMTEAGWNRINALLDQSWGSLYEAVSPIRAARR